MLNCLEKREYPLYRLILPDMPSQNSLCDQIAAQIGDTTIASDNPQGDNDINFHGCDSVQFWQNLAHTADMLRQHEDWLANKARVDSMHEPPESIGQ